MTDWLDGVAPGQGQVSAIAARLDRLPATRSIWLMVALISVGAFFEIYDLSLSAPLSLGLEAAGVFHRGRAGLLGLSDQASFIAATFAGLYAGTLGFSTVADRFGRRVIFTVALLWYSGATVVMGLQNAAAWIDLWRLIASIGAGVEMVAIDCYLAELTPKAARGRAFAVCAAIQFLSAPLVMLLAWRLIPGVHFGLQGWRWLTLAPALGAVLIWFIRRSLPESPRWLEAHGRLSEAGAVVSTIEQAVLKETGKPLPEVQTPHPSGMAGPTASWSLWRPPYRRRTVALIVFHVFQVIGYFGVSNWLPTLLISQGVTIGKSLAYTAVMASVQPIAPLAFSLLSDRVERKWLVVAGALLAAMFGLMMARMTQFSSLWMFTLVGVGVAAGNALMSLAYHTYQSEVFPTPIRARGVGFVYSFSRFSAIFSGYLIAAVLDRTGSGGVFTLIAGAMIIAAAAIGLFGPRTRGLALEQI